MPDSRSAGVRLCNCGAGARSTREPGRQFDIGQGRCRACQAGLPRGDETGIRGRATGCGQQAQVLCFSHESAPSRSFVSLQTKCRYTRGQLSCWQHPACAGASHHAFATSQSTTSVDAAKYCLESLSGSLLFWPTVERRCIKERYVSFFRCDLMQLQPLRNSHGRVP